MRRLYVTDPTINGFDGSPARSSRRRSCKQHTWRTRRGWCSRQFRDNVLWQATAATRTPIAHVLGVDPNLDKDDLPLASASKVTNTQAFGASKVAKTGSSGDEELVTGSSGGNAAAATGTTANNRPISTAVKAINNQLKESADRLDRTVKKFTGADQKTTNTDTESKTD